MFYFFITIAINLYKIHKEPVTTSMRPCVFRI